MSDARLARKLRVQLKDMNQTKLEKRKRRQARTRAKISGSKDCPRLSVFRSNNHIYAQLIDDSQGQTLAQFNDLNLDKKNKKMLRVEISKLVGRNLGDQILKQGFKKIIFDRGGYNYHGRVEALAEGLREAGLKF